MNKEFLEKHFINKSRQDKIIYLKNHGWTDYYNSDNWIREKWFTHAQMPIEKMGIPFEEAYKQAIIENEK